MNKKWWFFVVLSLVALSGLAGRAQALDSGRVDGIASAVLTGSQAQPVGGEVAVVPDMNGDGYDELAVGAAAPNRVYVVLGGPDGWGLNLRLANANPAIITYTGDGVGDLAGYGLAGVGDVNGDGFGDLVVGAPFNDIGGSNAGAIYVVLGSANPVSTNLGSFPVMIGEAAGNEAGRHVARAGDVNGDGYQDFLVGVPTQGTNGAVYLVLGAAVIGNDSLGNKIKYTGEAAGDRAGNAAEGLGDFNGDGYMDFAVGAPQNDDGGSTAGSAYVVLGSASPASGSLSAAIQYTGATSFQAMGQEVSPAGDFNGDGFADLMVSGPGTSPGLALVLGSATPASSSLAGAIFYSGAHGANVVAVLKYLAYAGDLNSDGYGDVLIGSEQDADGGASAGAVYIAYGTPNPVNTSLSSLPKLRGAAAGDLLGNAVAGGGDVNGDGRADVILAAISSDDGGLNSGAAFVLFGDQLPQDYRQRQRLVSAGNVPAVDFDLLDARLDFFSGALAGGDVSVRRHLFHPCATAQRLQTPIWTIDTPKMDGAAAATLRLRYTDSQVQGMIESNLQIYTRPADALCGNWIPLAGSVNTAANLVIAAGVTTPGQFTISDVAPSPTAIQELTVGISSGRTLMERVLGLAAVVLGAGTASLYLRRGRREEEI
jgi:hypothetical protein